MLGKSNIGRILSENYWDGLVKNLSFKILTKAELELLSLGPQFCPIKKDVDRARIQYDLNAGFRRMRLAYHFHPSEDKRTEEEKRFYLKKSYDPGRGNNKYLDVHQDFVQQKFDDWKAPLRIKDNMCPHST